MRAGLFLFLVLFSIGSAKTQSLIRLEVKDSLSSEPLADVTLILTPDVKGAAVVQKLTDSVGRVSLVVRESGMISLRFSHVGYLDATLRLSLPDSSLHTVFMVRASEQLGDVTVVASTRTNDPVETATTKVEVLGVEEMNEESTLKPGNIASILGDMSGIQIQQSSATSGNANVRIQGLDGKYTQILRDGMPLYEGYSGGFGILTIPPLDLQQIELIKGAASTLYGGGAIGGLINLISRKPAYTPDASFLVNQTTLKETNINAYYAQRWKKWGFSFFGGENLQKEVDVNKDGFSDVPNTKATILHPTLFIYPSERSYISLSWSGSFENRLGGDMLAIEGKSDSVHAYFEKNQMARNTFTLMAENRFSQRVSVDLKASFSAFDREQTTNEFYFKGSQHNFYTEVTTLIHAGKHNIVGGLNITGDVFQPSPQTPVAVGEFSNTVQGIFAQDTWRILPQTKLEIGLRADHHNDYGNFVLPRIALFHHLNESWGLRLGFGMGYKTPNALSPQIRDYDIDSIQPIGPGVVPERSYGANAEINYKKEFGDGNSFFINQAFFLTSVDHPVVATEEATGSVSFANESKPAVTRGFDTYVQMVIHGWELYLGYTYTDAIRKYLPNDQFMWITPRNRAAFVVAYDIEGKWRFGLEGSYTGSQYREDYSKTPDYFVMAAMVEKKFGPRWSLVLNGENLLDARQSRYESLYTGSITHPVFNALWAPIDGRVINLSLRFKPFEREK